MNGLMIGRFLMMGFIASRGHAEELAEHILEKERQRRRREIRTATHEERRRRRKNCRCL